ncbi:hypothetical protein CBS101457_000517 [Exobasidium rhododendri]|nr:hypothetical protein CBS101457_000517 [Exobasidium rhododendri]
MTPSPSSTSKPVLLRKDLLKNIIVQTGCLEHSDPMKWAVVFHPHSSWLFYWSCQGNLTSHNISCRKAGPEIYANFKHANAKKFAGHMAHLQAYLMRLSMDDGKAESDWLTLLSETMTRYSFTLIWDVVLLDRSFHKQWDNFKAEDLPDAIVAILKRVKRTKISHLRERARNFPASRALVDKMDKYYDTPKSERPGDSPFDNYAFPVFKVPKIHKKIDDNPGQEKNKEQSLRDSWRQDIIDKRTELHRAVESLSPSQRLAAMLHNYTSFQLPIIVDGLFSRSFNRPPGTAFATGYSQAELASIVIRLELIPLDVNLATLDWQNELSGSEVAKYNQAYDIHRERTRINFAQYDAAGLCNRSDCQEARYLNKDYCQEHLPLYRKALMTSRTATVKNKVRKAAYRENRRDQESLQRLYLQYCELLDLQEERCNACEALLDLRSCVRHVTDEDREESRCNVNRASLDRIIPFSSGGSYFDAGNVQLLCIGCQMIKCSLPWSNFLFLTADFAKLKLTVDPSTRLLLPVPRESKAVTSKDTQIYIRPWTSVKLGQIRSIQFTAIKNPARKYKNCDLTREQLEQLVKSVWIGDGSGKVYDATGLPIALALCGLDRIDPDGHYTISNVRILYTGFNLLRNDSPHDMRIVNAHKNIIRSEKIKRLAIEASEKNVDNPSSCQVSSAEEMTGILEKIGRVRDSWAMELRDEEGEEEIIASESHHKREAVEGPEAGPSKARKSEAPKYFAIFNRGTKAKRDT